MKSSNDFMIKWFNDLVDDHYARLCDFCCYILHTREVAGEIVDDVFIKVWERRDEVCHIENIKAYLFRAVKNQAINYLESKYRHPVDFFENLSEVIVPVEIKTPEDELVSGELSKALSVAINDLPEKCKLIFVLAKENGLKYKEIADLLGLSEKTVEHQVSIALRKIYECLRKSGYFAGKRQSGLPGLLFLFL